MDGSLLDANLKRGTGLALLVIAGSLFPMSCGSRTGVSVLTEDGGTVGAPWMQEYSWTRVGKRPRISRIAATAVAA